MRHWAWTVAVALGGWTTWTSAAAEPAATATNYSQVYELIRRHLPGISDAELDQAACAGLIDRLAPRVSLVATNAPASPRVPTSGAFKCTVIENNLAWVRVSRCDDDAVRQTAEALRSRETNQAWGGVVLDLRFAAGGDLGAAARIADLFLDSERVLLQWGEETARSRAKTNAIKAPVSILVNRQTSGPAEALAAILRHYRAGLLLGSRTAGQAAEFQVFPLTNGQRLRIATSLPRLAGGEELPLKGLTPDIEVQVDPEDEWTWFNDGYAMIDTVKGGFSLSKIGGGPLTNRSVHPRMNEAELVRQQREGPSSAGAAAAARPEPPRLTIQDPVLARAVDLLKGLALVRRLAQRG